VSIGAANHRVRLPGRLRCGPGAVITQPGVRHCDAGAAPSQPGAHHSGLAVAVKAGVAGIAAAHHAGVSVVTIIKGLQLPGHRSARLHA